MNEEQQRQESSLDPQAVNELFEIDPANDLSPAQMVRRALFPRWEVIVPAEFNPIEEEDRMIDEILEENSLERVDLQNRTEPPVH